MAEEREFRIQAGMDVIDPNGDRLGSVDSIVIEDETGLGRFVTVDRRLLPVETIENVEGNRLKVDVTRDRLPRFPEHRQGETPSPDDMRKAYDVAGIEPSFGGEG
jgi:sporulation protein YlmC with PRC-barrel domain